VGEQGAAFDTAGREANAALVACAQRFIELEELTDTDPESLALAALDAPDLLEVLLELEEDA